MKARRMYCPRCKKETTHIYQESISDIVFDGWLFSITKGFSLMNKKYRLKCNKCGTIREVR